MRKLHLGCGERYIEGFMNIDNDMSLQSPDMIKDIKNLDSVVKDSTVGLIYASHVLEHFTFEDAEKLLKHWYDKIEPGGILRLAVPDIEAVCLYYLNNRDLSEVKSFFWGGQKSWSDYHLAGWDFMSLFKLLRAIGFKGVRRYDWRDTEHADVDDYSQAYLPHMDKENGTLLSLNVEAVK